MSRKLLRSLSARGTHLFAPELSEAWVAVAGAHLFFLQMIGDAGEPGRPTTGQSVARQVAVEQPQIAWVDCERTRTRGAQPQKMILGGSPRSTTIMPYPARRLYPPTRRSARNGNRNQDKSERNGSSRRHQRPTKSFTAPSRSAP
jgi:hypothetical protein